MAGLMLGCVQDIPPDAIPAGNAVIFPDYSDITIPPNVAPLNFTVKESADYYIARFHAENNEDFIITSKNGLISIPEKRWRKLLAASSGNDFLIELYGRANGQWKKYNSITNHVAKESIDQYVVYRLIEPGFETWNKMGIYQRDLEDFRESPVMINELSDGNCMNCHAFCQNSSETMMFHLRAEHAGTVIYRNKTISKVNTKTDSTISAGVYPSWHPGGRYIAFSVNRIVQTFHAVPEKKIEVIDTLSDLILYDAEKNVVLKNDDLSTPDGYETFPTWSADGRFLYFCRAKYHPYQDYKQIRYDLLRIAFDPVSESFGETDTVISASKHGFSVSFPRVSPDGRYLLFCKTDYGNFTIWHDDTDLNLIDLKTGEISVPGINSDKSDSYHTWSSNGRWIVFSSRRTDGLYTRLYFTYFDKTGMAHKPFLLPQKDPDYNISLLKSYNVPELVQSEIRINPRKFAAAVKSAAENSTFKKIK